MLTLKQYYKEITHKKKYLLQNDFMRARSLIFVKAGYKKVNIYEMSNWEITENPMVTLYSSYIKLHYCPGYYNMIYWKLSSLLNVKFKNVRSKQLVIFPDGSKSIFFKGMKISYRGNPLLPFPRKYAQKTEFIIQEPRERNNALRRFYYQRKKATDRFEAAAVYEVNELSIQRQIKYVDVNKLPMDDVFKLQNVSHRKYLIDYYGMDAILAGLEPKVINRAVINGNAYELVIVKLPFLKRSLDADDRWGTYLRMVNPSTHEIHFEGVPHYERKMNRNQAEFLSSPTVRAALAWRDGERRYTVPKILT